MSTSFTSEITRILHDPSYFWFFRFSFDGALRLFPTVNTEAEVDSFPCWSRVVHSQWQSFKGVHSTTHVVTYSNVKGPHGCSKNCLIRKFCRQQQRCNFHFDIIYGSSMLLRGFAAQTLLILHTRPQASFLIVFSKLGRVHAH